MKKTIIVIIILIIIALGAYYFISSKQNKIQVPDNSISNTSTTTSTTTTTVQTISNSSVSIKNFAFNPETLTIKAGTKVTWTNDDTVAHTVTSDTTGIFDSGTLSPGQSFSFTFKSAGSVSYHCNIHKMMKATVIVQ